ncbi:hypothetical protein QE152_g38482, partial [Popillia japonica]
EIIPRVLAKLS